MTTLTISKEHIAKTPGVCGGKACIAGHRIRVMDIVASYVQRGMKPSEILDEYPGLTIADVHAALAYYHDHRDEVDADFQRDEELDRYGRTQPSKLLDEVADNLREKRIKPVGVPTG
jgi:uncharacterized protein (DUF433 family)